jgi:proteasome lid subunit RPN8/RPN11
VTDLEIPKATILQIVTHSFHEMPYEACGLLTLIQETVGGGIIQEIRVEPCRNDSVDQDSFELCADDHLRIVRSGDQIIGTYHSHPRGLSAPSEGDIELLPRDQLHLIVGMKDNVSVRAWTIGDNVFPMERTYILV